MPHSPEHPSLFDERLTIESPTGALVSTLRADATGRERGILLVFHGLAEHAGRYARFAAGMSAAGFHTYAHDHRGHGSTTAPDAPLRRFAKKNGGIKVLADCLAVFERARSEHRGDLPVFLFGHSMGGLIAMRFAALHGRALAGAAIWNTDLAFGARERVGIAALEVERALKGSDVASEVFRRATFAAWARRIADRRTDGDWLSHDEAAVDRYLSDALCGWTPTNSMALDLVELSREASASPAHLPDRLPVHVLSGTQDPATRDGEAAHALAGALRHAGSRDVTLVLQEGARHETLHEVEPIRAAALASLNAWLDRLAP